MIINVFSIFLGGGLGAVTRYLVGVNMVKNLPVNFPFATFLVNIIGSFLIGFLYFFFLDKTQLNPALKMALTVGFCGGLTTFSTFSLELFEMIENQRFMNAFAYVILSVIICLVSVFIGVCCAKIIR